MAPVHTSLQGRRHQARPSAIQAPGVLGELQQPSWRHAQQRPTSRALSRACPRECRRRRHFLISVGDQNHQNFPWVTVIDLFTDLFLLSLAHILLQKPTSKGGNSILCFLITRVLYWGSRNKLDVLPTLPTLENIFWSWKSFSLWSLSSQVSAILIVMKQFSYFPDS